MPTAQGFVARGFEAVGDAFAEAQAQDPGGAQLCVYRRGEIVVNLWAGRDPAADRPYGEDQIGVMMSCTKAAVAVMAHRLAERRLLDLDAPVADYWPKFAAEGKADVRVRHLLFHAAGLPGLDPASGLGARDMLRAETHVDSLAAMAPLWAPGTAYAYHLITFGSLLGELIRRTSGESPGRLFAEEIAGPLKLDFWMGLPEVQEPRVAKHFEVGPALSREQWRTLFSSAGVDPDARFGQTFLKAFEDTGELIELMNTREGHAAEVPAGGGIADAASLAKMYAAMIGEIDGVRLLKPEILDRARTIQTGDLTAPGDLAKLQFGPPQHFALGFQLPSPANPMLGQGSFGHDGAGGRTAFAHPETGVAVGYIANTMLNRPPGQPDRRWVGWLEALQRAVS